jgi:ABC-type amino acid transport substrate-binding protein
VWVLLAAALLASMPLRALAQDIESPARELVVGTKEAPPFAMKDEHGNWQGISIDLWRRVADGMGLHYRFTEATNAMTQRALEGGVVTMTLLRDRTAQRQHLAQRDQCRAAPS